MNIGNKIKELRKARGITQEQLAESIGISFQAVSKWETGIGLPDITLAPALASFFGVSMDELFDFHREEIRREALDIGRKSVPYREKDMQKGIQILEEGLKKYPANDILLCNMLYLVDYYAEPDRTIALASKVLDVTVDQSLRYDALRFMAYGYKAKGDMANARAALEQIPEIYFTHLSEMAYVLEGKEKMEAAQKQLGVSMGILTEMQSRIAECHLENGKVTDALKEYRRAIGVLDLLEASDAWDSERNFFRRQIEKLEKQLHI